MKAILIATLLFCLICTCHCVRSLERHAAGSFDVNTTFPIMYEISTRPWMYYLSQQYGRNISKLNDIPMTEFAKLYEQGVKVVWMMGVWQLGK